MLFPLLHGTLWYVGMEALPPVAVYGADHLGAEEYAEAAALIRQRVTAIPETQPIPYRHQNGGDYDEDLVLRPEHAPGSTGVAVHLAH